MQLTPVPPPRGPREPEPTLLERLDPSSAYRWPDTSRLGRAAFLLRYGALGCGLPIAAAFRAVQLAVWVARHGVGALARWDDELGLIAGLGMVAGYAVGKWLWARGRAKLLEAQLANRFRATPEEVRHEARSAAGPVRLIAPGEED